MKKKSTLKFILLFVLIVTATVVKATCPVFTFSPSSLPNGTAASAYSQTISASGTTGTVAYNITSGALPTGLTLSGSGTLSGTPAVTGAFGFTITATDSAGCTGSQAYSLIVDCGTIVFHPTSLPAGTAGVVYSQTITVTGAVAPFTYSVGSGSLPPGLTLNIHTGVISGTPTTIGTFPFSINVVDANACVGSMGSGYAYSITISCSGSGATLITSSPFNSMCMNGPGDHPTGYFYGFPTGGVYSGTDVDPVTGIFTPSAGGPYNATYTVTDAYGCVQVAHNTIMVYQSSGIIISSSATGGYICSGQPITLSAMDGFSGDITWSDGIQNGMPFTPTATTTYEVHSASMLTGCYQISLYTVYVTPPPVITATSNAPGNTVCPGTSVTLSGGGGYTYTWSNGVTNGVSFVPLATTTYTVTGSVPPGCSNTATITITVKQPVTVTAHASVDSICAGLPVTLAGGGANTYVWNNGVTNGVPHTQSATTAYTVTGTSSATGCSSTATVTVYTKPGPVVTISSTVVSGSLVCPGTSVTLTQAGNADSYSWTNGVVSGVPFVPTASTFYLLTGTSASTGCQAYASVMVNMVTPTGIVSSIPGNIVCAGSSITLYGTNETTYSWSNGISNGVAFVPTATTTYTVTGVNGGTGCSTTASVTITVNPAVVIGANASATSVCFGLPVTLTGSGASTYTWSSGVTNAASFVPFTTKTYTVTGTNPGGCTGTATVTVTVIPRPDVTITASATSVCSGSPVTLTAAGASTYTWDHGITDAVPFIPLTTASYLVSGMSAAGCTATNYITITVLALPTVTASASATSVCAGTAVTLSEGGNADTYTWSNGISNNVPFVPTVTTTYSVTGTNSNTGCTAVTPITITVNPLPVITASSNAVANTVCAGSPVTLTASGADSYSWDHGIANGVAFTPAATTTYNVTATSGITGCSATSSITITVNPLPVISATATPAMVCAGSAVTLSGSGTADAYSWTNGVADGVSFVPVSTATYTVTGTITATGCTSTATQTVTVHAIPPVSYHASTTTVCAGGEVTLFGLGANTYSWDNGITNNVAFNPTATTTYIVTGTYAGCSATASVIINVNPLPVIIINSTATTVCAGMPVTLSGNGAASYSWDNGITDGLAFTPSATTTYNVTGTTGSCSAVSAVTVTVNPLPVVSVNATATSVCAGMPVTLSGNGAASYSWDNGVTDGVAFIPAATTTYNVTGTIAATGCSATLGITITVNPVPAVVANATNTMVCSGLPVTLSGNGATNYSWDNGITDGVEFIPASTTTYNVIGTTGSCSGTSAVTVIVNPLPVVDYSAAVSLYCNDNGLIPLSGGVPAGGVYSGTGVTGSSFNTTASPGFYSITYTYTDSNGCVNSDTSGITLSICTGIAENAAAGNFTIYPNPNNGIFTVVYDQSTISDVSIRVTDVRGRVVTAEALSNFSGTYTHAFDLAGFDKGIYLVEISTAQGSIHKKIILQ